MLILNQKPTCVEIDYITNVISVIFCIRGITVAFFEPLPDSLPVGFFVRFFLAVPVFVEANLLERDVWKTICLSVFPVSKI